MAVFLFPAAKFFEPSSVFCALPKRDHQRWDCWLADRPAAIAQVEFWKSDLSFDARLQWSKRKLTMSIRNLWYWVVLEISTKKNEANWIKRQETLISRATAISQKPNLIKQTFERQAITDAFDGRNSVGFEWHRKFSSSALFHVRDWTFYLSPALHQAIGYQRRLFNRKKAIEWQSAVFFLPSRKQDNFIEETLRLSVCLFDVRAALWKTRQVKRLFAEDFPRAGNFLGCQPVPALERAVVNLTSDFFLMMQCPKPNTL